MLLWVGIVFILMTLKAAPAPTELSLAYVAGLPIISLTLRLVGWVAGGLCVIKVVDWHSSITIYYASLQSSWVLTLEPWATADQAIRKWVKYWSLSPSHLHPQGSVSAYGSLTLLVWCSYVSGGITIIFRIVQFAHTYRWSVVLNIIEIYISPICANWMSFLCLQHMLTQKRHILYICLSHYHNVNNVSSVSMGFYDSMHTLQTMIFFGFHMLTCTVPIL